MKKGEKIIRIVLTGGGTGGHIYPGIAVADEIKAIAKERNIAVDIYWIGSSRGMDYSIIEKCLERTGGSIKQFYGIPCGKLRRYFSLQNITDLFRIIGGFFKAVQLLKKINPDVVFSKGGFVSVPPCKAAKLLCIPYYTHECDFTPGLATRLNSKNAKNILISYEDTKKYFSESLQKKCIVTGNPIRPAFYVDSAVEGRKFLDLSTKEHKPVLLVLGGSSGARQINNLVVENLQWLKERFIVVHQTGKAFAEENPAVMKSGDSSYKPYDFIYKEMVSVIQASDIVLSRAGANSLWECAVCKKPLVLIPLCGSGTRGDQVDNALYFEKRNAALVLAGEKANSENLQKSLEMLLDENKRKELSLNCEKILPKEKPAYIIAKTILDGVDK
ncbi:MAG: undecaprenyldiphospho-muramoylpentapeptide beta-N-acetylglucosaminyltransferase [Treponema sp.]